MTMMTSWDLFEDLRAAQDEMLRMKMARAYRPGGLFESGASVPAWAPAVDIYERKDAYVVAVGLPGVKIDDLEITFEDGLLTIQGERHFAHDSSEQQFHRVERRYGAFRRSITLPAHVMAEGIQATADNGVLQILVPKMEEATPKRIQVRPGRADIPAASGGEDTTAG